jgi:hypothetical protein
MKRKLAWGLGIALVLYCAAAGVIYSRMRAEPGAFNQFMAGVPMPAMMVIPFEPLWMRARAGTLEPGQAAPDFHLKRHHGEETVRLSDSRGKRPVLLIFGSYT